MSPGDPTDVDPSANLGYRETEQGFTVDIALRPGMLGQLKAMPIRGRGIGDALQALVLLFGVNACIAFIFLVGEDNALAQMGGFAMLLLSVFALGPFIDARVDAHPIALFEVRLGQLRVTDRKERILFEAPLHQVEIRANVHELRLSSGADTLTLDTTQKPSVLYWLVEQVRERQAQHGDAREVPSALKALEQQRERS